MHHCAFARTDTRTTRARFSSQSSELARISPTSARYAAWRSARSARSRAVRSASRSAARSVISATTAPTPTISPAGPWRTGYQPHIQVCTMPRRPGVSPEISTPVIGRPVSRTEPQGVLDNRGHGRDDLADRAADVLLDGDAVEARELAVHAEEAQVGTMEPEADGRGLEDRVQEREGLVAQSLRLRASGRGPRRRRCRSGGRCRRRRSDPRRGARQPVRELPLQPRAASSLAARDAHAGQVGVRERLPSPSVAGRPVMRSSTVPRGKLPPASSSAARLANVISPEPGSMSTMGVGSCSSTASRCSRGIVVSAGRKASLGSTRDMSRSLVRRDVHESTIVGKTRLHSLDLYGPRPPHGTRPHGSGAGAQGDHQSQRARGRGRPQRHRPPRERVGVQQREVRRGRHPHARPHPRLAAGPRRGRGRRRRLLSGGAEAEPLRSRRLRPPPRRRAGQLVGGPRRHRARLGSRSTARPISPPSPSRVRTGPPCG